MIAKNQIPRTTSFGAFTHFSILASLGFFLATCGIHDVPVLDNAIVSTVVPGVFNISHNTLNNTDAFVGYHVYYKLYDAANITKYSEDSSYITDTSRNPTPGLITGKGYRKLVKVTFNGISFSKFDDDDSDGTIAINSADKSKPLNYYIDFSAGTADFSGQSEQESYKAGLSSEYGFQALLSGDITTTFLHRRLNSDAHISFFEIPTQKYDAKDADISSMIGSSFVNGNNLVIAIAVIPFGIDFVNIQRVYGTISMSNTTSFDYTRLP